MSYTPHSTDRSGLSQPNYRGFAQEAGSISHSSSQARMEANNMNGSALLKNQQLLNDGKQNIPNQQLNQYQQQQQPYNSGYPNQQVHYDQVHSQQQNNPSSIPLNMQGIYAGGQYSQPTSQKDVLEGREVQEKLEREKLISQIKQSQQSKDKNSKQQQENEENLALRLQFEMFEQQKQMMQQQRQQQQQQQQQQQDALNLQKQQVPKQQQQQQGKSQGNPIDDKNRKLVEVKLTNQKDQEDIQRRKQQQQYQPQMPQEDTNDEENIFQRNQQDMLIQRQREQEELLQRQYLEQQEQEEYYQQQLEMQHKQILEQQQLLDQMKQAMSQSHQQQPIPTKGKIIANNDSPESVKRSQRGKQSLGGLGNAHSQNDKLNSIHTNADLASNQEKRFEIIEKSLNRVCNQHDALMPLLQLLETVPSLQRSEQQVKNLTKKYTEVEKKLKEIETSEKKDTQYQHIFNNIDRNFKSTNQQVQQLKKQIITLEGSIGEVAAIPEAKLKEDTLNLYRQVDQKLDRNLRDVKSLLADFKNQVSLQVKRGNSATSNNVLSPNSSGQIIIKPSPRKNRMEEDIPEEGINRFDNEYQSQYDLQQNQQQMAYPIQAYQELNAKMESQLQQFNGQIAKHQRYLSTQSVPPRQQIDIDITNIYREIGMLRSEMELLFNQQRSQIIQDQLAKISSPTQTEKQLFIAGLEQNLFLQEIECFDSLNQQRLQNELDLLEDKLYLLSNDIQNLQAEHSLADNDSDRAESASQHLLIEQYRSQDGSNLNAIPSENKPLSNVDVLGYELKFIGDRLFNFRQQIHGTKKKYLCDCRRLEDRLQTLEYLSSKAKQEGTDNKAVQRICQIDDLRNRVEAINNSVGEHVATLLAKLNDVDKAFSSSKDVFKNTKIQLQVA